MDDQVAVLFDDGSAEDGDEHVAFGEAESVAAVVDADVWGG
ncbi:hypothetical protein [Actinokineospora spheciospongiae]|nr:hypothetical protein [Actinokineospora spheciospongiae]